MAILVLRRLAALVPILLLVSFGVFMLISLVPGDPAITLAGGENATDERIAQVREELRLDDPLLVQYGRWRPRISSTRSRRRPARTCWVPTTSAATSSAG